MRRILNVAEKNDAAKHLANIMGRGAVNKREGYSKFNKIYEFDYNFPNFGQSKMIMTSVSGHLLDYDFDERYRKWYSCDPLELFEAPLKCHCPDNFLKIKKTLEREVKSSAALCLWTDCDREGENIAFEIIEVCKKINPNIKILRARFSEITSQAVHRAINNLAQPDERASNAVNVRRELDLRIGAAFTRFQTLLLTSKIADKLSEKLISYGSCQFPTLGFVVERYKQIKSFVPSPFWFIDVKHEKDGIPVNFKWDRVRVFDDEVCLSLFNRVLEDPLAKVVSLTSKQKSNWRPSPMDTVTLEKLASTKLKINAKRTMQIAEKLYTRGLISYPRTETNIFPSNLNLTPIVENQVSNPQWGDFARRVKNWGVNPRQGKKTDNAHPPIYPTKAANDLKDEELKIYELITRHFLACVSKDALGFETNIKISINKELFHDSGLIILERNYLDVYPYTNWSGKQIPDFKLNEVFVPNEIMMKDGKTTPPSLLTESDLITLMEKHGIGTDATHADHIDTIKQRMYVKLTKDRRFIPCHLGLGLVEGYIEMGFELSRPHLRAALEADLQAICNGEKNPQEVLRHQINVYKRIFSETKSKSQFLTQNVVRSFDEQIVVR